MTKCDLCPHSHLENGKLICPYGVCLLFKRDLREIYKAIEGTKGK